MRSWPFLEHWGRDICVFSLLQYLLVVADVWWNVTWGAIHEPVRNQTFCASGDFALNDVAHQRVFGKRRLRIMKRARFRITLPLKATALLRSPENGRSHSRLKKFDFGAMS